MAEEHSRLAVLGTVVFYMVVAISMTLLNKTVLSSTPLPVFLLLCQSSVAVCLLSLENRFGPFKTPPNFELQTAKDLLPLVGVNILGLTFNNYCLQYVDASFHQVARGLVLPSTIIITIVFLRVYPSPLALGAAVVVTSGFFAGVLLDPNHASSSASKAVATAGSGTLGVAFGAFSSVMSACHAVLIKKGLGYVQGSPVALSYYNNIMSSIALIPMVVLSGELPGALRLIGGEGAKTFLWGASITGIFGFLISIASFMSIKVTSPVTHMISSAARGVLQTLLAVWIFGDVMSQGRIAGIFLIITGSVLYVYAKEKEKSGVVPAGAKTVENGEGDILFDDRTEMAKKTEDV